MDDRPSLIRRGQPGAPRTTNPADASDDRPSKLLRFEERWKAIIGIPTTLLALAVGWFALHDRISPPPPETDLQVASFDADTVLVDTEYTHGSKEAGYKEARDGELAVVSVGLRNRGAAPVFLTHAEFTFRAHEPFETCVQIGDAIWASQVIDVDVPLSPDSVPWVAELPISHEVGANAVDRLDFRFGTEDYVPFVEPSVVSVDIAVKQDDKPEPTPIGTAHLVVPAMGATTSLVGLSGHPIGEPTPGCSTRNLERMETVLRAPALSQVDSSPEFDEVYEALKEHESE